MDKESVNIIIHSSDMALFSKQLNADINETKSSVEDQQEGSSSNGPVTI